MTEKILATTAGNLPIVDGMFGAVVVAGQTAGAAAIVPPRGKGILHHKVARRTCLLTFSTMDADFGVDREFLVGHHEPIKITSDDVAHCPRSRSFLDVDFVGPPAGNHV